MHSCSWLFFSFLASFDCVFLIHVVFLHARYCGSTAACGTTSSNLSQAALWAAQINGGLASEKCSPWWQCSLKWRMAVILSMPRACWIAGPTPDHGYLWQTAILLYNWLAQPGGLKSLDIHYLQPVIRGLIKWTLVLWIFPTTPMKILNLPLLSHLLLSLCQMWHYAGPCRWNEKEHETRMIRRDPEVDDQRIAMTGFKDQSRARSDGRIAQAQILAQSRPKPKKIPQKLKTKNKTTKKPIRESNGKPLGSFFMVRALSHFIRSDNGVNHWSTCPSTMQVSIVNLYIYISFVPIPPHYVPVRIIFCSSHCNYRLGIVLLCLSTAPMAD